MRGEMEEGENVVGETVTWDVFHGDCIEGMKTLADNSIDAVCTDPPYGIRFEGSTWDIATIEKEAQERASQVQPRQRNGTIRFTSRLSRAEAAGKYNLSLSANREFQEWTRVWSSEVFRILKPGGHFVSFSSPRTYHRMACAVEEAGFEIRDQLIWVFGSGFPKNKSFLKPSHEPAVFARKPLSESSIQDNISAWGTGSLNIDACRISYGEEKSWQESRKAAFASADEITGRFPANIVFGEEGAEELNGQAKNVSRFFYCPKASKKDRCDSKHPTIKPIELMRWLVRLITPPGGTVLDPFAGSGTTGQAAIEEGFNVLLMEREDQYVADIHRRMQSLKNIP